MDLVELIRHCYEKENLRISEIASMYKLDPTYVYEIVYYKIHR